MGTLVPKQRLHIGRHCLDVHSLGTGRRHVVLVHGIGVSSRYFMPLARVLAQHFRVYVLDLPGYGKTPKPKTPLTVAELGQVVASALALLGLEGVTLIGHSMGCQIITHAAHQHTAVRKLIYIAPTIDRGERSRVKQGLRLLQNSFREPPWVNWVLVREYFKMGIRRYFITARYMVEDSIEQNGRGLTQPILIMRGKNDTVVRHEWTQYLTQQFANASMIEIPDAAHAVHMTRPDEVGRRCQTFLET